MRGRDDLEAFVAARTQDLHHDAYLLTADQHTAEQLVAFVLAQMSREHVDLTQAASDARLRMARTVATLVECRRSAAGEVYRDQVPAHFQPLATLSPRQRAILLLKFVDGYELRSIAEPLGLRRHEVEEAYAAIPPDLTDANSTEIRSLLDDFSNFAETPTPATTLAAIRTGHPRKRPRWTYAAATLVVALTVSTLWITQSWHDDWLRTAAGLNHTHGTHFPAYTEGYQLVGIQDVTTGRREDLALGARSALAFQCSDGQPDESTIGRLVTGDGGNYPAQCGSADHTRLMPTSGDTLLTIADTDRTKSPVGVYRQVPWSEYPVATGGFSVQTGRSLHVDQPIGPFGNPTPPSARGPLLTLRGTPGHLNGTFTGSVTVPTRPRKDLVVVGSLLSPTTTGRFRVDIEGPAQPLHCDPLDRIDRIGPTQRDPWCEIYDKRVPQVPFSPTLSQEAGASIPVSITVEHALGPWTLQVAANRYKPDYIPGE